MISTEDVPSLLTALSSSFINIPEPLYKTRAAKAKLERRYTNILCRKAFNCILFDYDEEFAVSEVDGKLQEESMLIVSNSQTDKGVSKKFEHFLEGYIQEVGKEKSLSVLAVLLPLANQVRKSTCSLLGYGELPAAQTLTRELLDELEIFKEAPLLAPGDSHKYTYYPPYLFSDCVMSVTDSAFSEISSTNGSPSPHESHYPIVDAEVCRQAPSTASGSYYTEVVKSDRAQASQSTLFGALTNLHTDEDMQLSLELPNLDIAPVSFDYTKESRITSNYLASTSPGPPPSLPDRPDSGFAEEIKENFSSEQIRSFQPASWEVKRRVGGVLGNNREERPYLTEAGPAVFDLLYRLQLSCKLQISFGRDSKEQTEAKRHLYVISMKDLMDDISLLLIGVSSKCFYFDENTYTFTMKQGLVVSGLSCQALASVCQLMVRAGTCYYRLHKLSEQVVSGLTLTAFLSSVCHYLSTYTAAVLGVSLKARSPLQLRRLLNKALSQILYLAELCHCDGPAVTEYPPETLPDGIDLLSYIYKAADNYNSHYSYPLMLNLLRDTSRPYLRFLRDWVFHGQCTDPFEEFIITVDPYKLETKDRRCWTDGYLLDTSQERKCLLLGNMSERIYLGGKSLALLRKIVPDHDILTADLDPPIFDICLSTAQQQQLHSQSTVYNEQVKAMVNHKLYTRKMLLEDIEKKRMETIQLAQKTQAEHLAIIYKRIEERRRRELKKKREYFAELKENMESTAERKRKEMQSQKEQDADLVENLAKREQLQSEADKKLEQQARQELLEYYRLLTETAAARERKALWRVRRHKLSSVREQWLAQQQEDVFEELLQLEAGGSVADEAPTKVLPVRKVWQNPSPLLVNMSAADHSAEVDGHSGGGDTPDSPLPSLLGKSQAAVSDTALDSADGIARSSPIFTYPQPRLSTPVLDSSVFSASLATEDVARSLEAALSTSAIGLPSTAAMRQPATMTIDKEYLVRRPLRRADPNRLQPQKEERRGRQQVGQHISAQSVHDRDSLVSQQMLLKAQTARMFASKESDEPDMNSVRMEKFRVINKRGHASHSSIQDIMYYGVVADPPSLTQSLDETLIPAVEIANLDDVSESSLYEHDYQAEIVKRPCWIQRTHVAEEESGAALHEHISLATLLQESLSAALTMQISLSNKALLSHYMVELEFDKHMSVLHNYILLAKGEFSLSFTLPLFEKLQKEEESRRVVSTYFLTDTLNKALQHVPMKGNQFLDNLAIAKGPMPRNPDTHTLNSLSWLSLTYKVEWPMNILITPEHVGMYEKIFSFMLSLKHISYLLADSWHSLRLSTQTHSINSESPQFRQLHLIRHDMQHFVKVMHGYLALQVTQVSWHQFQEELKTVTNLDALYESHNRFISRCLSRCFLSYKVQQIKQVVDGILKSIYKFHALLRLGHWELNDNAELVHTEYEAITKAYLPFREFTQFLNKVLTKMTESDKNVHLRELQLMLNFNGYYQASTFRH